MPGGVRRCVCVFVCVCVIPYGVCLCDCVCMWDAEWCVSECRCVCVMPAFRVYSLRASADTGMCARSRAYLFVCVRVYLRVC